MRNINLWISLGFCVLGILDIREESLNFRGRFVPPIDNIAYHLGSWAPFLLAVGATILCAIGQSARLSLWVLAFWWLGMVGASGLYSYLRFGFPQPVVMPIVQILWSVICIGCLGYALVRKCICDKIRIYEIALPIVAAILVGGPSVAYFTTETVDRGVFSVVFTGWRVFLIYAALFFGVLVYDWVKGIAALKINSTSSN